MSPRPISPRTRRIATMVSLAASAMTFLAACSDSPTAPAAPAAASPAATVLAPTAAPAHGKLDAPVLVNALTRATRLPVPLVGVAVIGPNGGTLEIKQAGLKVTFPKGLVTSTRVFWATALPGDIIAYDFGPSSDFGDKEVVIEQQLRGTSFAKLNGTELIQGAYFRSFDALRDVLGVAEVTELRPATVTYDKNAVRFGVTHFSGYMVSTGRTR
jgi:hypothetical protein